MHDQQMITRFADTRDSLRPPSIAALIDLADGNPFSIFADPWVYDALHTRNLVEIVWHGTPHTIGSGHVDLTDYGRAFVSWYRQPRDLPVQLDMFAQEAPAHDD